MRALRPSQMVFRGGRPQSEEAVAPKVWEPTPRQLLFMVGFGGVYEALYGGARMGGKTDALLMWKFLRRQKYPKSRGLFVRRQLTELTKQGAAWDRAKGLLGNSVTFNETDMTITFPNGSVEEFGHCKTDADAEHYKGAQYHDIAFDQLEEFTEQQYLIIQAACRVAQTDDAPKDREGNRIAARIRSSANPGGVGHTWVKKMFLDVALPETVHKVTLEVETPFGGLELIDRERVFVPSTIFDNPYAGDDYKATLASLPEPYKSMYLYGKWDVFVGQAFASFHPIHPRRLVPYHVIPVAPIPDHWERVECHDWGHQHPMVTLWLALDPEGGAIVYKELRATQWKPREIAKQILRTRGTDEVYLTWCGLDVWANHVARVSDPSDRVESMQEQRSIMASVASQYEAEGLISIQPTISVDRIAGKQMVESWLADRGDGVPYLRIMDNCTHLIETMELIPMSPTKSEDVHKDWHQADVTDDAYDALRYGLVSIGEPQQQHAAADQQKNRPTKAVAMGVR